ncbi:MAG: type II restriction endonuclease, partial [Planctomycetes bacterium]|nr:type II restriction endonuclease [Planctomycetota bacterium]
MKLGYLSQYFDAVASKRLSAVETDPSRSHQHEFNGVKKLTHMFGIPSEKQTFPATFLYLCDDEYDATPESGFVTWSDYRSTPPKNTRDKIWLSGKRRSPECRLYYPTTTMSMNMAEGDLLVIAKRPNGHILVIVAEAGSDIERQLCWLFNLGNPQLNISLRVELETEQDRLGFASRVVLEAIGVTVEDSDETWLDRMLRDFNGQFPDTSTFSLFARDTMPDIADADLKGDPDRVLLEWCTREEILFRTLEKHLVAERLRKGFFGEDAFDEFDELSKQVTNRRKSRAGRALENHLEHM